MSLTGLWIPGLQNSAKKRNDFIQKSLQKGVGGGSERGACPRREGLSKLDLLFSGLKPGVCKTLSIERPDSKH